ncbi:protein FAR1-RELATED SEQUENCE 5-like isoform X2 [Magnolia sinica]|uniref:protein FAR1-RELATED SEQUENCE 5-like isoform X2 n=1 Tax=Magnolia sinica TaxID=86752 RepID=UPI00265B3DAB|nr:protein FAR1-RELATED SEQUENCE 5-like isoform X2 [Magnolia sinica]
METRSKLRALREGRTGTQDGSAERTPAPRPSKTEVVPVVVVPLIGEDGTVLEPYVGMEFDSEEDARKYYNDYAMRTGFGSRVSRNRRSRRDGEIIARDFVCFKEGFRIKRHGDNGNKAKRNRINTREGCLAMISVKKTSNGKWVVSKFIKEHNHALLSPSEASCLRSHRSVSGAPKKLDVEPLSDKDRELIEKFEGAENLEPYEGMELESEEAARIYYSVYARRVGFRSRISKNRRSRKDGKIIARTFVCYKEGFRINRNDNNNNNNTNNNNNKRDDGSYRPRAVTREGCEATFTVKKSTNGRWVVSKFVKEHNHPLLDPGKVRWLRSHASVSYAPRRSVDSDGKRIAGSEMKSLAKSGLSSNAGLTDLDSFNRSQAIRKRKKIPGKDPQNVLDYLEHMQSENPAFYYAVKIDEEENLRCIFWADARARMAYNYFGDVVRFDTTYKSSRYEVPFAPFTGVNHHQQSTFFGCALLYDETESTFVWLFNTWVEAMSGRHPITIITDQDATVEGAVTQVFPKSRHCFCKWRILQKAPKQLSQVNRANPAFLGEFQKCINLSASVNEFESSWKSLMDRYGIKKNEWLQSLYTARQKWAPVFLHDTFSAQLSPIQDNECVSPYFDGYVTAKTTIEEFIMQYERALASRYEKELEEDIRTTHTKPNLKTRLPIEKQAANAYTRVVFLRFQEEIYESLGYVANKVEDGAVSTYAVSPFEDQRRAWTVTLNMSERKTSCSCLMFESCGILCRHALIVLTVSNFMTLPSHYILERWTRNAKNVVGLDKRGIATQANCRKSPSLRHSFLCKQAIRCAEVGSTSVQDYDVAMRALREAWEKILVSKDKDAGIAQLEGSVGGQRDNNHLLNDANNMNSMSLFGSQQPKKRGRPRKSGSKTDGDKVAKNMRKCTLCKEPGHDSSNCPRLRPLGYSAGGGMLVVDAGPSDLHGRGGMVADQLGRGGLGGDQLGRGGLGGDQLGRGGLGGDQLGRGLGDHLARGGLGGDHLGRGGLGGDQLGRGGISGDQLGRGGISGDQLGFSEGILDLSLGDRFDSHGPSSIHNFAPSSFFQIASLANPRLLNANEEFTLTGGRPSFGP